MKNLRPLRFSCRPSSWSDERKPDLETEKVARWLLRLCRWSLLLLFLYLSVRILVGCAAMKCRPSADVDLARWVQTQRLDGTVDAVWLRCRTTF